jgi:hypothetical protein
MNFGLANEWFLPPLRCRICFDIVVTCLDADKLGTPIFVARRLKDALPPASDVERGHRGLSSAEGATISPLPGAPAAAGLQLSDVITKLNGQKMKPRTLPSCASSLHRALQNPRFRAASRHWMLLP